jgi:hypothetical protein
LGPVAGLEFAEVILDAFEEGPGFAGAAGVAQGGAGSLSAQAFFQLVREADEPDDFGGVAFPGFEGFDEATPDVGHAARGDDIATGSVVGVVNLVAVALEGPAVEGIARDGDAAALQDGLLAVEREVVGVFADDEAGDEVEAGEAKASASTPKGRLRQYHSSQSPFSASPRFSAT